MQVNKILKLLNLTGKTIPRDMGEQLEKTYLSESRGDYIKLGDMDIIHMVRAFNKMHQEKTDLINTIYHKYVKTKELDG